VKAPKHLYKFFPIDFGGCYEFHPYAVIILEIIVCLLLLLTAFKQKDKEIAKASDNMVQYPDPISSRIWWQST